MPQPAEPDTGRGTPTGATDAETLTLEAFADTIVPGEKRFPDDVSVAGACAGAGAVAAGALELLRTPATGVTPGLPYLAETLNKHSVVHAADHELALDGELPAFVALPFAARTAVVRELTRPGHPEKDGWVALALFCNMAFDSAAHLHTADAIRAGHPGLAAMGFFDPGEDGLWRFPGYSYRRKLADLHPNTTPDGSPA